jgi:hypothetical protein
MKVLSSVSGLIAKIEFGSRSVPTLSGQLAFDEKLSAATCALFNAIAVLQICFFQVTLIGAGAHAIRRAIQAD